MNTRSLEYLVALEKYRHFQNAADACNITQPTMSFQIRKLENELGVQIVERTTRKFSFTKTGLDIVKQAEIVLSEYQRLKKMANEQYSSISPDVVMGIIPTLAPFIYQYLSSIYSRKYPAYNLKVVEGYPETLQTKLNQGEIDCAITCKPPDSRFFTQLDLFSEPVVLGLSSEHPLSNQDVIDLKQLKGNSVLMPSSNNCFYSQVKEICDCYELAIDTQFTNMHFDSLKHIISSTSALCFFPAVSALGYSGQSMKFVRCQPSHDRKVILLFRSGHSLRKHYYNIQHEITQCMIGHLTKNSILTR